MEKRVLIVDDIAFNIEFEEKIIQSMMGKIGIKIQIDTASTLADAISSIIENESYNAMIVDINLPDGSGIDLARIARKKNADTRIAAPTIYPNKYEKQRSLFDLFLKKSIMPEAYKQNFARLLQL